MSVRAILKEKGDKVITVPRQAAVKDVVEILAREGVGSVVVSDDGAAVSGILVERDIIKGLARHGAALLTLRAEQVMTSPAPLAKPDMPLLHVLDLMTQGRFRHMPVVEDGRLIGLVSIGDAVKARLDILESEADQLKDYISGR